MSGKKFPALLWTLALVLFVASCQDAPPPTAPDANDATLARSPNGQAHQQADLAKWFAQAAPEVLALPQTVFADHDKAGGRLVFGVENRNAIRGVEAVLTHRGVPSSAYEIKVTEPIRLMASLRDRHRPTMGGLQIHFGNFLCTLGFSVDHAGGRSFITNSHCTDRQGGTEGTTYFQPLSTVDSNPIAVEVDDPDYFRHGQCPRGRKCRFSDASRALYEPGIASDAEIARTSGPNNGSLEVVGVFEITSQDNSSTTFSGTINKVGRTTGWTQGEATATCVAVNVSGTNITQLCQTLVEAPGEQIVGGGDSGSPVFRTTGSNTAELIGIMWGGSGDGELFVFSPLSGIQDELGAVTATTDGVGGDGGGDGGGGDGGGGGGDEPNCPPKSNKPACR